jgi:hypothetical protein
MGCFGERTFVEGEELLENQNSTYELMVMEKAAQVKRGSSTFYPF